ncbi:MAG: TonB-dependent receptor [Oceanicaulis sp.]
MTIRTAFSRARLLSAAALAAALSAPAFAEAHPDVVVVQSSPLGVDNRSSVGAVTVIDEDALVRNLEGNIADTLERVPGVTSSYFGPASGRPIIRGLGAERVRFLINGLGGLDASSSSPDHAVTAEVLGAQGVEVLRGPAAIAFGGGAIGGVVNVLDGRVPTERTDGPFDGFAYAGTTSVDDGFQLAGRLGATIGAVVIQGDYVRRDAGGFEIPGYAETEAEREEHHGDHDHADDHHDDHADDHDDDDEHDHDEEAPPYGSVEGAFYTFESASLGASIVEDWGYFGLSVKETDAEYGLPGHAHAHGHEDEHDDDHDHGHDDHDHDDHDHDHDHDHGEEGVPVLVMDQTRIDLRGQINLDGFFNRMRFAVGHSDYTHAELEGDEIGTLFDVEAGEARFEISHDHGGVRQGAWGVTAFARDFEASGEEAYIEPVTTQDYGLFATERWDYDSWGFEGGVRYDGRTLDGVRAERDFNTVSASGSVFARPSEPWFLAATVSRTERAPSDVEVFSFGPHAATRSFEIGDLTLDTETAWSIEGRARYEIANLFAELDVFVADYDGFIGLFPTGAEEDGFDVFEYRQEDARLWGFELYGESEIGSVAGFDLIAEAGIDYVRAETDDAGNLPRIPPLSANLALTAERGIWSARGEARLVAEQDDTAAFERPTEGYALFNADLVVTPVEGRDLQLIAGVRNITDEEARIHSSFLKEQVPLAGRSVRFAIRSAF